MPTTQCQWAVIADDITGAAEIAGIAHRFGFQAYLIMYRGEEHITPPQSCDMLVFATDTRSMTEAEAIGETIRIANIIRNIGCIHIFKKTDSALRGHIAAELKTLMEVTGMKRALLLPQNPSRGRTLKKGKYYINRKPLDKTPFAYDPEFPAATADVSERLFSKYKGVVLAPQQIAEKEGIYVAEAATPEDVARRARELNKETLAAGGADFFTALLTAKRYATAPFTPFEGIKSCSALIVLGSTSKHPIPDSGYLQHPDIVRCNIPRIVFFREISDRWIKKLRKVYAKHDSLILCINHPPKKGRDVALRLREEMGKAVTALLAECVPQELIIEGGATAFSILKRTGWNTFSIACEAAPGVIRMTPAGHPDMTITLKPGSYPWGNLYRENNANI